MIDRAIRLLGVMSRSVLRGARRCEPVIALRVFEGERR